MCAAKVFVCLCNFFVCVKWRVAIPVWGPSLAMLIHLQHDLGGVEGRAGVGVQQKLLVLGQILSGSLLGQPSTVEQLSLQQGQVCLQW